MSAAPFMQLYVADYLGDTRHLTTEQHGAYLLLLMAMWRADGWLPNDEVKLARIVGLGLARWRRIGGDVMAFCTVEGDRITQKRLVAEIEKAKEKSQKRSEAGRAGGHAKALKDKQTDVAKASGLPRHSPEPDIRDSTPSLRSGVQRARPAKGERLPDNWQPKPPHFALARTFGKDPHWVHSLADGMRDWAKANGHRQVGRKSDWDATFSNFIRRDGPKPAGRGPPPQAESGWRNAAANVARGRDDEPGSGQSEFFGTAGEDFAGARPDTSPPEWPGAGLRGEILDPER